MKARAIFIGLGLFVFILLASYFANNMFSFDKKSIDCEVQGGKCINITEGCVAEGLMPHPDASCHLKVDDQIVVDDTSMCCIKY